MPAPEKHIISCRLCQQRFALKATPDDLTTLRGTVTKLAQHLMNEHPSEVCAIILSQFEEHEQPRAVITG